ncbi:hypothetical protein [Flavobacterium sp.]|uniref:hypothetical protein n=1 Tax=Flavobacterium sp. TaxID=239 RepID=UPI00286F34E6|nr:hypothetical protein [Flavobacterium sp.]
MKNNLIKIITYIFGGFFSQFSFLIFWFFVKKRVSLNEIGKYQLWLFIIDLLVIISMLGIDSGYAKLFYNSKNKALDILSLKLINSAAFISVFLFGIIYLLNIITIPVVNIFGLFIILFSVFVQVNFNFLMNKLVVIGRSKDYVLFQISRSLLIVLISIILVIFFEQSSIALFLGQLIGLALLLLFLERSTKIEFNNTKSYIVDSKEILQYTLPLMLSGIIGVITVYSSRLILSTTVTIDQVGALGVYMGFSSPIIAVIAVINKFYYPFSIKKLSNDEGMSKLYPYFLYIVLGYIFVFYLGVLVYYLFLRDIIFTDKLIDNSFVFLHIASSSIIIVLYTLYSPIFIFKNSNKLLIVNVISLIIGSLIQYFLLLHYGFKVVGIGKIFMDILILIFSMLFFKNEHNFNRYDFMLLLIVLIAIVPILFLR